MRPPALMSGIAVQRNKSFRTCSIPEDLIAKGTVAQKCCQTLSFVRSYNNQSESDNVELKGH